VQQICSFTKNQEMLHNVEGTSPGRMAPQRSFISEKKVCDSSADEFA
jgi:hypothetical protein